jgi:TP901 family phage tail tape measure protein
MAKKAFEMNFQIGGKLASSFSNVFSKASSSLGDLKNQSRQTQRALDQLGNDFRRGKIHQSQYAESTERLTRELGQLERAQNRINTMNTAFGNGLNTVRSTAGIAAVGTAVAATGLAFKSVDTAADFQQQMTKVGVIAGASESELKKLNDTALEYGANSSKSATEVAVAMKDLAAKGMNTNKIIGAMPGILAAAESSGEDLAMTSNVVTSALNAFELKATEANRVADVMAMSANKTAAGVEDLGYSFKYAAPVAKTLGISLEELATATGVMVDKGLSGEQAGTSLRMALIRLSKPPNEARKALDKLNISVTDSQGEFKSLAEISEDWNKSTEDLTETQKVQYAATVFGTEAATGMLNLFSEGPKEIDRMTKALENSAGSAKAAAKAMKDNYAGSLEELKGSIETAQIKFATPILPVFQDVFDGISSSIDKNMGGIERAGEKFAAGLKDVFEPLSTQKPDFNPALKHNPEYMKQYNQDMSKYMKFNNMDFGDKVVYMLDEASAKMEKWLSGSGGESMNKIFTKLGEIAAKAWYEAFTGTVKSAGSNLMQGNVFAGLGLGAAAWMMGGGALAKGAIGAGKWGYGKAKGKLSSNGSQKAVTAPVKTSTVKAKAPSAPQSGKVVQFPDKTSGATKAGNSSVVKSFLGKTSKVLGKFALPLTVISEAANVIKSEDKTKATAEAGGGIAGGLGGAKVGAAIGTAIAPGIGTAVGGFLGGIGGYIGGKWLGGKAVDKTRQVSQPAPQPQQAAATSGASSVAVDQSTAKFKAAVDMSTKTINKLTTDVGQASGGIVGSFTGIKTSADKVKMSLDILTAYTGQASGWLVSLNGIQTAGQRVITALNNLETRINNVELPGGKSKRVSYDG